LEEKVMQVREGTGATTKRRKQMRCEAQEVLRDGVQKERKGERKSATRRDDEG